MISKVEEYYLNKSDKKFQYKPAEKSPVIQVNNFPELGKLTALRFIEWVIENPNGVVSLPTGKTPEHFIRWVSLYINEWGSEEVQNVMKKVGVSTKQKPDLSNLTFVQIDEFYPIDSAQHNSFYYYINKYYLKGLAISKDKALLINVNEIGTAENLPLNEIFPDGIVDLSLRTRYASSRLERLQKDTLELVDQFCTDYEKKIRDLGGIGFFLGGIGPDGHIGFNVKGSDHYSTTRLIPTNYETQAAAASDLGGIEIARNSLVITIGLDTITYDKNSVSIIIAAGEAKSNIVRDSIENEISNKYPATVLQKLKNSRFYLTNGAALRLLDRRYSDLVKEKEISDKSVERAIINLAIEKKKKPADLTEEHFASNKLTSYIFKKVVKKNSNLTLELEEKIKERLNCGMKELLNESILHTAPHHDDIMLGYLPLINHLVRSSSNTHHFSYMTSGFTAVTNNYMLDQLLNLKKHLDANTFSERFKVNYFDPTYIEGRKRDVNLFLDGISSKSRTLRREAEARRLLRNITEIYDEQSITYIQDRVYELINYFKTQYPGRKDISYVQKIKGMQREWEVEILWAHYGFSTSDVSHLRLGFYKGEMFTESPEFERDVIPIYELMIKQKPSIVTVALDPEGSGPDTHYKVLQAVSTALKKYIEDEKVTDIKVWGYRNVWYRFHPAEANLYIPVSLNSMAISDKAFMFSFGSQKTASFPSWEYDGPFSKLAQKVQDEQYQIVRRCLGKEFFLKSPSPRVRAAHGMIFLKELTPDEFFTHSLELKKLTEN